MKKMLTEIQPLIRIGDFALLQMFLGTLKKKKNHDFLIEILKKKSIYVGAMGEETFDAILNLFPSFTETDI